jgi:hypothetical protein
MCVGIEKDKFVIFDLDAILFVFLTVKKFVNIQ